MNNKVHTHVIELLYFKLILFMDYKHITYTCNRGTLLVIYSQLGRFQARVLLRESTGAVYL